MKATLEKNSLMTNQFCTSNNISNNNLGRTTHVATNLQSYFPLLIPTTWASIQIATNFASFCKDHHAHWGSRWAVSEATCRSHAQSAQFDTGTKSFLKHSCPLASQLILTIYNESRSAQNCNKRSKLSALAFQISQHERVAQNQISQQIGDFMRTQVYRQAPQEKPDNCIWVIMKNFNSVGIFTKCTKSNNLNKLCQQFNTDIWQDAKPKRIGTKPPMNNNSGIS